MRLDSLLYARSNARYARGKVARRSALVDFESPRRRVYAHTHPRLFAVIVPAHEVCPSRVRNCPCRDRSNESLNFNTSILSLILFYSPVFCAIIGSIASNTTRKIGVILTTFFPVFPRSPVITAHLTPPSQRATYEKINHLRHKHTTFITTGEEGE